jgi:hypothetical protein
MADVVVEGYYDPQISLPSITFVLPLMFAFVILGLLLRARNRTEAGEFTRSSGPRIITGSGETRDRSG